MSLTAAERENSLVYDEESERYKGFCSSSKEKTRLTNAGIKPYRIDAEGNWFYYAERKQISFRSISNKPRQKREMSEEHKAKLLAGRKKNEQAKKGESGSEN